MFPSVYQLPSTVYTPLYLRTHDNDLTVCEYRCSYGRQNPLQVSFSSLSIKGPLLVIGLSHSSTVLDADPSNLCLFTCVSESTSIFFLVYHMNGENIIVLRTSTICNLTYHSTTIHWSFCILMVTFIGSDLR